MIDQRIVKWRESAREKLRALGLEDDVWPIYERLTSVHGSVENYWSQPKEERTIESVVNHLVTKQEVSIRQIALLRAMVHHIKERGK